MVRFIESDGLHVLWVLWNCDPKEDHRIHPASS